MYLNPMGKVQLDFDMNCDKRVAIVVDSAASLPSGCLSAPMLYVVPMHLVVRGESFRDGVDVNMSDLYKSYDGKGKLPTTSAPSPSDFLNAFREASISASSVLCLTVASHFSASYQSARTAAVEAERELESTRIVILDSGSAAGGEGLVVTEAWRTARCGGSLDDVIASAEAVIKKVSLIAFLDTLYYLWKGGRVPGIAYAGTSLLGIKPLFELRQGKVRNIAKPRTSPRAMRSLVEMICREVACKCGPVRVSVMHVDDPKGAEILRGAIESEVECEELFVAEFSPVMGAHTGPGLLGAAYWA